MLAVHNGTPVLVKDVGRVVIGIAPRLGQFGYQDQDDAVEGVILMRTGEKTQDVLKRVEAKTKELNEEILPKDVKVLPFYDRSDLIALTTQTVERNLLRGMLLVVVVLIFFLYDVRAGLIVADDHSAGAAVRLHLPRSAGRLGQPAFHRRGGFRHSGGRRGGDGGEHFPPDCRAPGAAAQHHEVIVDAAAEVDRPIFYAVAVIVASFLPIYVLSGPSGKLFKPMADTMIFALVGSLIVTLTLLPVLCSWFMRKGVRERRNAGFRSHQIGLHQGLDFCLAHPWGTTVGVGACCWPLSLLLIPRHRRRVHAAPGRRRAVGARHDALHDLVRGIGEDRAAESARSSAPFPKSPTVASEHGRPDDGTDPTGFFNVEFFVGLKPYREWKGPYRTKAELIEAINEKLKAFPGIIFNYTQPAEDAVDEAETGLKSALAVKVFGTDLETLEAKGQGHQAGAGKRARHHARSRWCRNSASRA